MDNVVVVFAPQRRSIQCHLWHCQRAHQTYCSNSHHQLALTGEEGRNAIVITDGMKDQEIYEISGKIVRSKVDGKMCGVPHVDVNDLCTNPWELGGFVFYRELEMNETRRCWVFICEKNPEGFGNIWKLSGISKEISAGIYCQKYILKQEHVSPDGRFLLMKITGRERFTKALYWMTFVVSEPKVESKKVEVTVEGENSKRKQVCNTSQLPNKVMKNDRVDGSIANPNNTNMSSFVCTVNDKWCVICCSYSHNVAAKGKFIAVTDAATDIPQIQLKAIDLLCPVDEIFFDMYDRYEPLNEPALDNCFTSTGYDVTTHFKTTVADAIGLSKSLLMITMVDMNDYNEKDPKTPNGMDLTKLMIKELIRKFGLDDNTIDFIGHAIALHTIDQHLHQPALDTVMRMKLYTESLARFEGSSPYIFPLYVLGELPQVWKIGRAARVIAIMSHPIPNTNNSHTVQDIIPQTRCFCFFNDIWSVFCCSYSHNMAPKGNFVAFVSIDADTDNPQTELKAGIDLLGPVDVIFLYMCDNAPASDNCCLSKGYDAVTHFETTVVADVLSMYTLITGKDYDEKDSKTHNGMDLSKLTTKEMIAKFGLDDDAIDFNGPASALHTSDQHLHQPTLVTVMRMKLYAESLARFEGSSPYGLGELPQVRKIGRAARAIAIMSHPIPKTNDYHAVQIIIPQKQLAHRDMYVFCCSYSHNVAPKGKFIAFVSTDAETDDPQAELKAGIDLLGPVDETFFYMCDNESASDNCFISTGYDAVTHFETTVVADVLSMYTLITGKDYDEKDPKTLSGMDLTKLTTKERIAKIGLDDNSIDFIGHAIVRDTNGQHLHQPALDTVMRMRCFTETGMIDYYGGESTSLSLNQLWKIFKGEEKGC